MNRIKTTAVSVNTLWLALSVGVLLLGSCARTSPKIDVNAYNKEIAQWQTQRLTELKGENGWLTLVGLFWLKEGDNRLVSDPSNDMVLPAAKLGAQSGVFTLKNGLVMFEAPPKSGFTVDGKPVTRLELKSDE